MAGRSSTLYIAFLVFLATAESFTPRPATRLLSTTRLHLRTNQGSQLVAAWNAAHCHDDDDEEEHHHPAPTVTKKESAARAFVSKVFCLPSTMIRRHPHQEEGSEDVIYPIVGFQFVPTNDNHSIVVPTAHCSTFCSLPHSEEPVYGWYTAQACALGNPFSDDYCNEPPSNGKLSP